MPKILDLKPGTRIVTNTFTMGSWNADQSETIGGDCVSWCTALLWYVPAKVAGTWTMPEGSLTLTQEYQVVSGRLGSNAIADGKLKGDEITFSVGPTRYTGRVTGKTMQGTMSGGRTGAWMATKK
jgi:hypothetical protein